MTFATAYVAFALVYLSRYVSQAGRDRFMALPDHRARAARDHLTSSWIRWGLIVLLLQNAVQVALGLYRSSWAGAAIAAAGVTASVATLVLLPRARAMVEAASVDRALPAEPGRETSARRSRRVHQIRTVVIVAFAGAVATSFLAEVVSSVWVYLVLGIAWLVTIVGVLALAWTSVWIYGDEQPAEAPEGRD